MFNIATPSLIREETMAPNIAARRAAKAVRRKAVLAERRKSEMLASTLPAKVRRAASAPIRHCLLNGSLFESGIGTLILVRGVPGGELAMASFLLDVHCLGIKDVVFRSVARTDLEEWIAAVEETDPLVTIEPSHARKLLQDLRGWAESIGFAPAEDFEVVERLFGDVSTDSCDMAFQFGRDGKPFYVPGPSESPMQIRRRIEQLRARFGETRFGEKGVDLIGSP
jgi:hypothetical protein